MHNNIAIRATLLLLTGLTAQAIANGAGAQTEQPADPEVPAPTERAPARQAMSAERLGELIQRLDDEASHSGSAWEFTLETYRVMVIYDTAADRMRIMIPIRRADELEPAELTRLLQANFDTALDARYAIAQNILWATFIHPLSPLTDEQFLLGLGQTANIVASYGTTYSSGMLRFGGGDSAEMERRELLERLKELGTTT